MTRYGKWKEIEITNDFMFNSKMIKKPSDVLGQRADVTPGMMSATGRLYFRWCLSYLWVSACDLLKDLTNGKSPIGDWRLEL